MSFNTDRSQPGVRWSNLGTEGIDPIIEIRHRGRAERFGFALAAEHVKLILASENAIGHNRHLADFWRDMKIFHYDDAINTFYPTALDLLGISAARVNFSSAGPDFGRIVSRKLNYQHFAGFENEANVRCRTYTRFGTMLITS